MQVNLLNNLNYNKCKYQNKKVNFTGVNIEKNLSKLEKADYFKSGLDDITQKYEKLKANLTGWFQKRKRKALEEKEILEIKVFSKSQEEFIKQQDKNIELSRDILRLARLRNDNQEKINDLEAILRREEKIKEKTKLINKNKSQKEGFDSIAGYIDEKFILTTNFINKLPLEMAGECVELPNCILFFGPNGNGKTSFAKAFAKSAACEYSKIKGVGKTQEARQRSFFNALMNASNAAQEKFDKDNIRTIILVDEFDGYANETSVILPELKGYMENCSEDFHCTLFATTNNPLKIASTIRDAKRIPIKVSIDPPDKNNIIEVFKHYLTGFDCEKIDYNELADVMLADMPNSAYNNSQIEQMCKNCIEEIDGKISQEDLLYQIKTNSPGITKDDLLKFQMEKNTLTTKNN